MEHHNFLTDDHIGALARIAVAFSDQGLELQQLESVYVIGMDATHVDIAAVVCGGGGECVTVKVPVQFPQSCKNSDDEECILMQLDVLDHQAGDLLQQMEGRAEWEEERRRQWDELMATPTEYPSWWQPPLALLDDCRYLAKFLNNLDFQPEIQSLVGLGEDTNFILEEAAVVDLSPAGLYLRARVYTGDSHQLLDISVPFETIATTEEELRSAVLTTVASSTIVASVSPDVAELQGAVAKAEKVSPETAAHIKYVDDTKLTIEVANDVLKVTQDEVSTDTLSEETKGSKKVNDTSSQGEVDYAPKRRCRSWSRKWKWSDQFKQ